MGAATTNESEYVVALVNRGLALGGFRSPVMRGWIEAKDDVFAQAKSTDGFVWRTSWKAGDGKFPELEKEYPTLAFQVSVWESPSAARKYVYGAGFHSAAMKRGREWFHKYNDLSVEMQQLLGPEILCFWIKRIPSNDYDKVLTYDRVREKDLIWQSQGPTQEAFDLKTWRRFPAPDASTEDKTIAKGNNNKQGLLSRFKIPISIFLLVLLVKWARGK